jgi:protocatechuate 3,4-dioxygenase beta subunit
MKRRAASSPVIFALAVSVGLFAAWPHAAQQTRDTPGQAQAGTAILTGVVVSNDTEARPLRRASVSLNGGNLRMGRTALTDDNGAFIFAGLPSGTYNLNASKPAWLGSAYSESGRGSPTPVKLTEGQRTTITIRLTRSAVISGTVRDPLGRPMANVRARVMRYVTLNGQRVLQTFGGTGGVTDDRGMYRVYGLQPGDYIVSVVAQQLTDVRPVSDEEIRWAKSRINAGPMSLAAPTPQPPPAQTVGYAPVYFPGTADPLAATTITLRAGDERSGVDVPVMFVPTSKIEGIVVDADGRPVPQAQINLAPGGRLVGQSLELVMPAVTVNRTGPDGKFTFSGLPPGQFIVVARGSTQTAAPVAVDRMFRVAGADVPLPAPPPPPPLPPNAMTMWAMADVELNGHDISGLALTLRPGLKITGRVLFQGSILPLPAEVSKTRLTIVPAGNNSIGGGSSFTAQVAIDGTFTFQNVVPGKYRISGTAPTGTTQNMGWRTKSVMVNGRDALDFPIEVGESDVAGVIATFTDKMSDISGSLVDAAGKPVNDYWVVVIPADRTYWMPGSRRIFSTRPAADGKYRFPALPAGDYCLVAIADITQIDMTDPAILEQLAAAAVYKFTLAESENKVLDLKLAR